MNIANDAEETRVIKESKISCNSNNNVNNIAFYY